MIYRYFLFSLIFFVGCHQTPKQPQTAGHSCTPTQSRFSSSMSTTSQAKSNANKEGMVLIPGGAFSMGGDDDQAWRDEYPKHEVVIDSFWMDVHEVTNAQFADFVEATGYVTTAEKAVDWEEIKKELPPGTPKPDASQLAPALLVFVPTDKPVSLRDVSQWWQWRQGAIDKALTLSESLEKIWVDGDLKQRQKLQHLVFPSGLGYDKSNDQVRTPKVNAIFGSIPILSKEISNIKKGEPIPVNQFSGLVTQGGFEPPTLRAEI